METKKFKTNIKCTGCIATVTPFLNEAVGEQKWEVDLTDPSRVLTVKTESDKHVVVEALEKAGYKAEPI
jgi:copper chaperone CopZ